MISNQLYYVSYLKINKIVCLAMNMLNDF